MSFLSIPYHSGPSRWAVLWYIVVVFGICFSYGQELRTYEGRYSINHSLKGDAVFQYYMSQRDTVIHGDFRFQNIETRSLDNDTIYGISVSGNYREGLKSGLWEYSSRQFEATGKPRLTSSGITYEARGSEYTIHTHFNSGKAEGDYTITKRNIINTKNADTLFYFSASCLNTIMVGSFKGYTDALRVRGSFNEQGMPEGNWSFTHQTEGSGTVEEHREYADGILKRHFLVSVGDTITIEHDGLRTNTGSDIRIETALDATYLEVLAHASQASPGTTDVNALILQTNTFLNKAFFPVTIPGGKTDKSIWELIPGSIRISPPTTRVHQFPITGEEKENYENSRKTLGRVLMDINRYLNNSRISTASALQEDISIYVRVMDIYRKTLGDLRKTVTLLANTDISYINRNAIASRLLTSISFPDSIPYVFRDDAYTSDYSFPSPSDNGGSPGEQLYTYTESIGEAVKDIVRKTDSILQEAEEHIGQQDKEMILTQKRDSLLQLYSNDENRADYNRFHHLLEAQVKDFIQDTFRSYAGLLEKDKSNRITSYLNCYDELFDLYETLVSLPDRLSHLNDLYTRSTWNPYTFTYMDERIKSRLYRSYENEIYPYVWEELENNIRCGRITLKAGNFELMYNRMVTLQKMDTRDIEKKLRRARNLKNKLKAIDLDLN